MDSTADRLERKFDMILATHEALRHTNRELTAENKQLKTEVRRLRSKIKGTVLGKNKRVPKTLLRP